jgi:hypothetical protein
MATEGTATADDQCVAGKLYRIGEALVRQLVALHGLTWDAHHIEDATHDLFLAGWQVWRDTKNEGLAKNRMRSRQTNLLRDFSSEVRHGPEPEAS